MNSFIKLTIVPLILLCFSVGCGEKAEKADADKTAVDDLQLEKIPPAVMDALKVRFPDADIKKWTKEEEGEIFVFDIEFEQNGWKFEADIKEDGSIHNWEKALEEKDLPDMVKEAAETAYPGATIVEIMVITAVTGGEEALEGYEIVLQPADADEVEIMVAPDGAIVEDSGEQKQEE
jgi:hypothetical protein